MHGAAAEHMNVQMIHRLPTVRTDIDYRPITFGQLLPRGHIGSHAEQMAEEQCVFPPHMSQGLAMLTRDDEEVHRRLRRYIAKSNNLLILVQRLHRNLTCGDLAENTVHAIRILRAGGQLTDVRVH